MIENGSKTHDPGKPHGRDARVYPGDMRFPFLPHALALSIAGAGCSAPAPQDPGPPVPRAAGDSPRYDLVWQVATHNSYWVDRGTKGDVAASGVGERMLDQLLTEHVRGLEIDIHKSETPHELRVYHTVPGNSLCDRLDECLGVVRAFHRAMPEHGPLVLVLELKELFSSNFDDAHTIDDLDRALGDGLGSLLYRPRDFLGACDDHGVHALAECAKDADWPSLEQLRGKVIVALLGNWDAIGAQATADWVAYATSGDIHDRAAFPMASSWKLTQASLPTAVQSLVTQDDLDRALSQSAFLQVEALDDARAAGFLKGHGVIRIDNAFSMDDQAKAVSLGMQLLQSDSPWAQYEDHGAGEPARSLAAGVPEDQLRERGDRLLLDGADAATVFAYRSLAAGATSAWETVVAAGNGETQSGCLRAESAPGAKPEVQVALCVHKSVQAKTESAERLEFALTVCQDGTCDTAQDTSHDGQDGGPGERLSLAITPQAGGSCVSAQAARLADKDLQPVWAALGEQRCFGVPLVRVGLARPFAAGAAAPARFFGTERDGAAVRGADFEAVAIEPDAGGPAAEDPKKLTDASWP
jgi:hypothetical protein